MAAGILKKSNNKTRTYVLAVVIIILVVTAIGLTFTTYSVTTGKIAFTVRDIGAASDSCDEEISSIYGNSVLHKSYDHGSSKYDELRKHYDIWYRFTLRSTDKQGIVSFEDKMIRCEVWELLGYVSRFEVYDL